MKRSVSPEKRKRALRLTGLGALVALSTVTIVNLTSQAIFTSTATVTQGFASGTLVVSATTPSSTALSYSNMVPGDSVVAPITVTNQGTVDLRYSMTSTLTGVDAATLGSQLALDIRTGVSTCTTAGFTGSGSSIYSGPLGTTSGAWVIGNPITGQQDGDRPLLGKGTEVLCVKVSLPLSADSSVSGLNAGASFRVDAEQSRNT